MSQQRVRILVPSILLLVSVCVLQSGCGAAFKRRMYESAGRDAAQQPERVVLALGLAKGDRVADLGSGSGYFTFRLAQAVGDEGKVYATDIDTEMNALLAERARELGASNVEIVQATPESSMLPEGGIDLVFTSNTYHHIGDRVRYFGELKKVLSPIGRIAIVDYHEEAGWFVRTFGHYTDTDAIRTEMAEAGYDLVSEPNFLTTQSFLIFSPRG